MNKEIVSKLEYVKIPLSNYYGVYHLNGGINDINIEFILDTGASESMISKNVLDRITEKGNYNVDHLEGGYYSLADGSNVFCERINIKTMMIGGYTIRDVVFGIMPTETDNLLGRNVLDQFKKWTVNKNLNELTLVK
ncbi:retropepsin-like aspartic protease [uncultured Aquimarina sp.]|uniref:retropepsin-like aspartic protease n=1 Tax=uncultured Aquimarina sp. TaxID=575652 RepID=UPI002612F15D|nr:retropepsin-like aspartic protease [uncultured Aquimarina sp.]